MNLSIRHKIFLILLLSIGLVVTSMTVLMTWSLEQVFVRFIDGQQQTRIQGIAQRIEREYIEGSGWERLDENQLLWAQMLLGNIDNTVQHRPELFTPSSTGHAEIVRDRDLLLAQIKLTEGGFLQADRRVMLLDADKSIIYGEPELADLLTLRPITVDKRTVGYLGVLPGPSLADLSAAHILDQQTDAFAFIALTVMLVSALLAYAFADRLIQPLRAITEGSHALAAGHYDSRVPVRGSDELGRLARDFNSLAEALQHNEGIRRQWVADISHEIRTPLAVLRGELEALQDGVRSLDSKAVNSLHGEILRLNRLVDDLYELSMTDLGALQYRKTLVDPVAILLDDLKSHTEEFRAVNIDVTLENRLAEAISLSADPDRLEQLFYNLLGNTLRYTDAGGRLLIRVSRDEQQLILDFMDSAPGVPEEDMPRLFDRLYRVESSRSRAFGGAGLGLAICRNIVHAHGGTISAQTSSLGGLWVRVTLPL
ncbi:MAG: HAMP domain-containing protein [Gammaproteobacteria bacterium]|nr:HAMP domain-containing protein [Gammaproteobacteria bacterium]